MKNKSEKKRNLIKCLINDINVASIAPSSKFTIKKLFKKINFNKNNIIVEYGPGDGVISKQLLKKMSPDSKLILIESNLELYKHLTKINDKRVLIYNESACNIQEITKNLNLEKIDYIISGIPFSLLSETQRQTILKHSNCLLKLGGKLLIYQFSPYIKKKLKEHFHILHSDFELINIPPLFIYEAVKS